MSHHPYPSRKFDKPFVSRAVIALIAGTIAIGLGISPAAATTAFSSSHVRTSLVKAGYDQVPFVDVLSTHSFYREIFWMKDAGLTEGYSDGTFRPKEGLTREAMAAFLYRQAGRPAFTTPSAGFTDVQPGHKFYREIMWMKATGLSKGYADGSYRPSATLSRSAMAAFMYRQAGEPGVAPKNSFYDVPPSHQFYREIEWMRAAGITTGNSDGTYRPNDPVTREAMAAFMYRQSN